VNFGLKRIAQGLEACRAAVRQRQASPDPRPGFTPETLGAYVLEGYLHDYKVKGAKERLLALAKRCVEANKPKRFLVFGWPEYEACGGMSDLLSTFATLEAAKAYAVARVNDHSDIFSRIDCFQIVDRETLQVIERIK
jgi:hypothetical protein